MQAPMPPSFMSGGQDAPALTGGEGSIASRQQKMLRQRQLALKRQRELSKGSSGVVVQHEVPLAGPTQSSKKAFQFLVELPRPASCNDKTPSTSVKVLVSAEPPDSSPVGEVRTPVSAAASLALAALPSQAPSDGPEGKSTASAAGNAANLHISDLDSESGTFNFNLEALAAEIEGDSRALRQSESGTLGEQKGPKEKGWDLEVKNDDFFAPSANDKSRASKLWRPWKKASVAPKTATIAAEEPTCVSSFAGGDPLEESFDNKSLLGVVDTRAATPWPASDTQLVSLGDTEAGLPGAMNLDDVLQ